MTTRTTRGWAACGAGRELGPDLGKDEGRMRKGVGPSRCPCGARLRMWQPAPGALERGGGAAQGLRRSKPPHMMCATLPPRACCPQLPPL